MNLFRREWNANIKQLFFWCLGIAMVLGVGTGKISAMTGANAVDLNVLMKDMPRVLQNMFGVGIVDYSKAIGMYSIMITYIAPVLGFHAVTIGASGFSKEERDRTFEFLYVKGRRRSWILAIKLAVSLLQIVILNLITFLFGCGIVRMLIGENIVKNFFPMMMGMFFLQLVYLGAGYLISFLAKNQRQANSIAFGVVMLGFLLSMFSDLNTQLEFLQYITPFKYFDGKEILQHGINGFYAVLCTVIFALCMAVSFWLHEKRDLRC